MQNCGRGIQNAEVRSSRSGPSAKFCIHDSALCISSDRHSLVRRRAEVLELDLDDALLERVSVDLKGVQPAGADAVGGEGAVGVEAAVVTRAEERTVLAGVDVAAGVGAERVERHHAAVGVALDEYLADGDVLLAV